MDTSGSHFRTPLGKPRARAFGIDFDGETGPNNAITDVAGVSVGYATLIAGDGPLDVGRGPVRTGVTAILPRPRAELATPVYAGMFSANGDGEMTGSHLIEELGAFNFPITVTNTHSCGIARDGTLRWLSTALPGAIDKGWALPVAAETYDGFLNDINGHRVTVGHVAQALDAASSGPIEEGGGGGGTGMIAYQFKAGSGTASRRLAWQDRHYTVDVFVQANFGKRRNFAAAASAPSLPSLSSSRARRAPKRARSSRSLPPTRRCCRTS